MIIFTGVIATNPRHQTAVGTTSIASETLRDGRASDGKRSPNGGNARGVCDKGRGTER